MEESEYFTRAAHGYLVAQKFTEVKLCNPQFRLASVSEPPLRSRCEILAIVRSLRNTRRRRDGYIHIHVWRWITLIPGAYAPIHQSSVKKEIMAITFSPGRDYTARWQR